MGNRFGLDYLYVLTIADYSTQPIPTLWNSGAPPLLRQL